MDCLNKPSPLVIKGNLANNWKRFKTDFEVFLIASGKETAKEKVKVAMFKNLIGGEAADILETLDIKKDPEMTLEDCINEFDKYCEPKVNILYERYSFYNRSQKMYEPFDDFYKDLGAIAEQCNFKTEKDALMRDRLVFGMRETNLKEKFIKEGNPSMQDVVDRCRLEERTRKQAEEILKQAEVEEIKGTVKNTFIKKNENIEQGNRNFSSNFKQNCNYDYKLRQNDNFIQNDNYNRHDQNNDSSKAKFAQSKFICQKCGVSHDRGKCPAYNAVCYKCQAKHHFARCCRAKHVNIVGFDCENVEKCHYIDVVDLEIYETIGNKKGWFENFFINNVEFKFKVDTGSEVNIIPLNMLNKLNTKCEIESTDVILRAFGGSKIVPYGVVKLSVRYQGIENVQSFVIVDSEVTPIIGLELIKKYNVLGNVNEISREKDHFIKDNESIFKGLGKFPEQLRIVLKEKSSPITRPPRRIPIAIRAKVKEALDNLEKSNIIEKLSEPTEWISNLVVVQKPDGSLRICLDPKFLNDAIKKDYYEIPKLEDLSSKLAGGELFTVLDLKDGFYQVELDNDSRKLCAFSTPFGSYQFKRLPFGINIAPETFQKLNEKNFGDIPGVHIYIDDLLITGRTEEEHDQSLKLLVERAKKLNIKFNQSKVQYRVKQVTFLGHIFSKDGISCDPNRIKAITQMKDPTSKKELQRFLGMVNYLRSFVHNMAEMTEPIRQLLKKDVEFCWLEQHIQCVKKLKEIITNTPVLQTIDINKKICIQTDASQNGIGCVLLQNGKPVAFASRSLTDTEKRYAQIEKEMLAILFSCIKFHHYIFGRQVEIHSDHKPLVSIVRNEMHKVNSSRLQRMKLKLLKYEIDVIYKPGKEMHIADHLSRSYLTNEQADEFKEYEDIIHTINMSDHKKELFIQETAKDEILSMILKTYKEGWPNSKDKLHDLVKPFWKFKGEIFCDEDLIYLGDRIIVPFKLRQEMLQSLHTAHQGVNKTKQRAREILYWPGLDTDIEDYISKCRTCEKHQRSNTKEPLIPHKVPDLPFQKVACDIMQVGVNDYLVITDYYSKWIEILVLKSKQSGEIIEKLKQVFATHGIPKIMICDNMPFASREMDEFSKSWEFEIKTSSPNYPRSNGQAEKAVHIAKNLVKKCIEDNQDLNYSLLEYRNHPVANLGASPSQLLLARRTRSKIPIKEELLKPKIELNVVEKLKENQDSTKTYYDVTTKRRPVFEKGQSVVYRKDKTWEPAQIISKHSSPRSYLIKNEMGRTLRRNSFHLRYSNRNFQVKAENDNQEVGHRNCSDNGDFIDQNSEHHNFEHRNLFGSNVTRSGRISRQPRRFDDYIRY